MESWRNATAPGDVSLWGKNTREQVWGVLTFLRASSHQSGPSRGTGQRRVQGLGLGGHGEAGANAQQTQRAVSPCGRERGELSLKNISPPCPLGPTAPFTLTPSLSAVHAACCIVVLASHLLKPALHTVPTQYLTAKPLFGRTTLCTLPQPAGSTRPQHTPCRSLAHLSRHVYPSPIYPGWLPHAASLPKGRARPSPIPRPTPELAPTTSCPLPHGSPQHTTSALTVPVCQQQPAPTPQSPAPSGPTGSSPPSPAPQPPHGRDGGLEGRGPRSPGPVWRGRTAPVTHWRCGDRKNSLVPPPPPPRGPALPSPRLLPAPSLPTRGAGSPFRFPPTPPIRPPLPLDSPPRPNSTGGGTSGSHPPPPPPLLPPPRLFPNPLAAPGC